MLPVLGLLRTYPCPHAIAGLCDRPNCFYSHKKNEIQQAKKKINADIVLSSQHGQSISTDDGSTIVPENESDTGAGRRNSSSKANVEKSAANESGAGGLQSHGESSVSHGKVENDEEVKRRKREATVANESAVGQKSKKHRKSSLKEEKTEVEEVKNIKRENSISYENHRDDKSEKQRRGSLKGDKTEVEEAKAKRRKLESNFSSEDQAGERLEKHRRGSIKEEKVENEEERKRKRPARNLSSDISDISSKKAPANIESLANKRGLRADTNGVTSRQNMNNDLSTSLKSGNKNGSDKIKAKSVHELINESTESSAFMLPESESADDDDPDQIELECLQMFNSYKPNLKEQRNAITPKEDVPKDEVAQNKRVAHSAASEIPKPIPPPSKPRISATEAMLRRYEQIKQQGLIVNADAPSRSTQSSEGKKRIAHVSNVSGLMKPATGMSETKVFAAATTTIAHTVNKGESRQAHKPKVPESTFPAPKIPWESTKTSKIPVVVRQKILDQLFQECKKIYDEPQDAATRALAEEKELSTRCSSKAVYFYSGTNVVSRLRKEANAGPVAGSSKCGAISHFSVIAGASGARNSWSIESVKKMAWPPPGPLLYIGLTRYLLTEEQLVTNSFPRRSPLGGGRAVITPQQQNTPKVTIDLIAQPFLRVCDRCTKSYKVDKEGLPTVREKCVFHNGRKFKRKVNGIIEGRYTCCDGDVSAEGCSLSDYHVSSQCSTELRGFVKAIKDPGDEDSMGLDPWDIIALDCEMIYTTHGNELARVTIIGFSKEILYDEFVKPIHPVLDYNTKFSGITEKMLDSSTTTLTDVQAVLLTRLKPNTIIVGHSLENDLLALKLIHSTVVDTSVLFPHRLGPPLKRALRNLTTECLGKIIQMGEGGHDSAEDARSALELAFWKLKEDSKLQDCFSKT